MPTSTARILACAALASLGLAPGRARAQATCDLDVKAEPAAVLGPDAATVRVAVVAGEEPVRLRASVGRFQRLRAAPGGLWLADWVVPPRGDPRVAIVSAFAGERCGFVGIPVAGWAKAVVKARPGESVQVEVGETRFGPAKADAAGQALVEVFVLPGTRSGWRDEVAVPVREPPGRHLDLVLARGEAAAAGVEVTATVFAVAADGTPWHGAAPELKAAVGELSAPAPAGPGAWRARWLVPAAAAAQARISARLPGEAFQELRLGEVPGPATRLQLTTDRHRAQAGDLSPVEVAVRAFDSAGNPTDAATPALEDDLGALGEVQEVERGSWRAPLPLPADLGGRGQVEIRARVGTLVAAASVELVGGPPAWLDTNVVLDPLPVAGTVTGELSASALDAYGNLVDARGITARAVSGTLGAPRAVGDGRIAFPYRLPAAGGDQVEDLLTVRLGELSAELPLRLRQPPPALALAPRAGVALRSGGLGIHAGVELSTWSRKSAEDFGLSLGGGAWTFPTSGRIDPGAIDWKAETRMVAATVSGAWRTRLAPRLLLSLSAGAGATYVQHRTELANQRPLTDAGWAALGTAALTLGARVWRGGPFVEARATWVPSPGLASLRGAFAAFSFSLGYWLDVR